MKTFSLISRWFVGLVFIFSGFVKGIDPLGTAFRIEDYLVAYQLNALIPFSLALSVFLCTVEFSLGLALILNIIPRISRWLLLLMMSFFTLLTFYDAIYEPVPDCGCFGDAIVLTNWQTFYKNIVLMVPTMYLLFEIRRQPRKVRPLYEWPVLCMIFFAFILFSLYNYRNLPVIDLLAWKVGNNMVPERTLPVEYYLTYRNKETGEIKEYLSPNYPFNDAAWVASWEFVSRRVVDPNPAPPINLQVFDSSSIDVTESILRNPEYQFVFVAWKIEDVDSEKLVAMNDFFLKAEAAGHSFVAIANNLQSANLKRQELNLDYDFLLADPVELKIMLRSNPGLLLLKNGVVVDKWSYRNFPAFENLSLEQ